MSAVAAIGWGSALDAFRVDQRREGRRSSTITAHLAHLRALARLVPAGPTAVTADDVAAWLEERGRSRSNAWKSGRVFFTWGVRVGVVTTSPVPPASTRRRPGPIARSSDGLSEVWLEALGSWVELMQAEGRAVRTTETRLAHVRPFARRHSDPWAVSYDDLVAWLGEHEWWAPDTRKAARSSLRGFYGHAVTRGLLAESPADALATVKVPRAVPRPAPTDAFQTALLAADDRGRLLLLLGAYAGLRAAEIAAVRPSSDLQDGMLYVTGKGGHQRVVPMHPLLTEAVAAELQRRRGGRYGTGFMRLHDAPDVDGWLFPSPGGDHLTAGSVTRLLAGALPDRWTAHTLRHRFASQAYAAVLDIRAVQELLGHSSPLTTARYTAVSSGHLVRAVLGVS